MGRIRYDKEFKLEAVRLVLEGGYSQRQAAESLGVNISTLKIWIDRLRHEFPQAPRKGGASAESTIKRLEAENARLRMERDILKKATTFFAKESDEGMNS